VKNRESGRGEGWAPRDGNRVYEALGAIALVVGILGALYLLSLWLSPSLAS
jgi:hypothetical protein